MNKYKKFIDTNNLTHVEACKLFRFTKRMHDYYYSGDRKSDRTDDRVLAYSFIVKNHGMKVLKNLLK